MKKLQSIGFSLAILFLLLTLMIPAPPGLTTEGKNTIGLTMFFLVLMITEALPLSVTSLLTVGLIPVFGVTERFSGAVIGFAHPVIFFIIASFGIAGAITNLPLAKRFILVLLNRAGYKIENILLVMIIATAIISFFMSNVPTCAIMMSAALGFIDLLEDGEEKKSLGKTFMIAIPVATMIGGMATPASSSLNLLAISLLEQYARVTITFVQWMAVGIPLVVVMIPLAWLLIVKVYKPAQIETEKMNQYKESIKANDVISKKEIYVIIILTSILALWIASSWVEGLEVFTVAVLGCVLFFMPGINILSWDKFISNINWDIIFISGTILSIADAFLTHNISDWLFRLIYPAHLVLSINVLVGFAALISFLALLVIPSAPALITVLSVPFVAIAIANDVSPSLVIMALAFCACNCYLFPLDTVQLLTYSKGHYRMTDMCKSTIFLQISLVVILAFWIPFMGKILQL